MKFTVKPSQTIRTAFCSDRHLPPADRNVLISLAGQEQPGFYFRFALAHEEFYDVEQWAKELRFSPDIMAIFAGLFAEGFHAVNFDLDGDPIHGAPVFTDSGSKITPLAYDLPMLPWHELDDAQKAIAAAEYTNEEDDAETYHESVDSLFIWLPANGKNEGQLYHMADCLRLSESELSDYGYHGYFSESAFSSLVVQMSDDSETLSIWRATN